MAQDKPKNVLLIEPNYKNKYPPIGLMKLSTYHKIQGDKVTFFKGNLKDLTVEIKAERCLRKLTRKFPSTNWEQRKYQIKSYLKTRRLTALSAVTAGIAKKNHNYIIGCLKESAYSVPGYSFDRVYVATLFTFYWEITIKTIEYAKTITDVSNVYVGGVMASLMKDEIREATGVNPIAGLLDRPESLDSGNYLIIDELALDYSILDEIDYQYPTQSAYFTYMTKGCTRKCAFCSVPKLEPTYKNKIPSLEKYNEVKHRFGDQRNLMLMDNNVLASPKFPEIVQEIKQMGFEKNATYVEPNQLEISIKNLRKGINKRGLIRRTYKLIHALLPRLSGNILVEYQRLIRKFKIEDLDTTTRKSLLLIYPKIALMYEENRKKSPLTRYVDFNQGTDARYVTEDNMKLMSELPIKPLRIAFDHIGIKKTYTNAIELAAKYGIKDLSNYILYNFMDRPEDFYQRIKINADLGLRLNIKIFSFPMKYIPLFGEEAKHRRHIGPHWNKKFIRAVQSMLNATKGIVAPGYEYFEMAFGSTPEAFMELLYMPESYIINRNFFQNNQMTQRWRSDFADLSEVEKSEAKKIIENNDFQDIFRLTYNNKILRLLTHYQHVKESRLFISLEVKKERNKFNKLIKKDIFLDLTLTHDFDSKSRNSLAPRV